MPAHGDTLTSVDMPSLGLRYRVVDGDLSGSSV